MSCNYGRPWVEKAYEPAKRPDSKCQNDKCPILQLDKKFLQEKFEKVKAEFEKAKSEQVTDKIANEEKALAEVRYLEAEMANAFNGLVAARRTYREALRELNQKYLLLGLDPVKIEIE